MNSFDWNRSKKELIEETVNSFSDIFENTDYRIIVNTTDENKMADIFYRDNSKRSAFVCPMQRDRSFTFAYQVEYINSFILSGARLGDLKEIKKDRYPGWRKCENISYDDMRIILSAFVKHN